MSNLWVLPADLGDDSTSEFAYEACKSASGLLWALSGRKFSGLGTVTERYIQTLRGMTRRDVEAALDWGTSFPLIISYIEDWARPRTNLRLRGFPVVAVTEVLDANGDTVDPSNYRLVEHSTLVFDPGFTWDSHDITVTYDYGTMPPQLGRMAARQLAIEFCHLWAGEECAFPERVTSVSRLGVSFTILDNQDFIDDMRTGVYAVDLFLKSVNPDRARARARVFSVDIPRAKRQPN